MEVHDLHPPDDYSHRFFIWHEWIQANGPLTTENVFEYFASSMFYDKQSNNQVLRMQTMHTGMPIVNEAAELKRFTGIEFALVHSEPPTFFIIHKRERLSPEEVRPLAAYFIMNNRIYQSPDVYTVLSNRLLTSLYSLQSTLETLRKNRPDYTPRTGFDWPISDAAIDPDSKKKKLEDEPSQADTPASKVEPNVVTKRHENNWLLLNAMRATAAHSNMSFSASSAIPPETSQSDMTGDARQSATPGPSTPQVASKLAGVGADSQPVKGAPGAGKKKRKRTMASTS